MITFPNCKINLGLDVVSKRADGYHNLETIFFPLPLTDVLEITVEDDAAAPDYTFEMYNASFNCKARLLETLCRVGDYRCFAFG